MAVKRKGHQTSHDSMLNVGMRLSRQLRPIVDHRAAGTLATKMRQRRFKVFREFIAPLPRPVQILDLGGEAIFWELMGLTAADEVEVTILNSYPIAVNRSNFHSQVGDVTCMPEFTNKQFPVLFSNSVIEHLGTYASQIRMAKEVQRVGQFYFVQTPNRNFPLEPHFLVPFFQFFPLALQVSLIRRFNLGWYSKIPDSASAQAHVKSHRLLTEAELHQLFPTGAVYREMFAGLVKSLAIYGSAP